jgi:hypothetical protein
VLAFEGSWVQAWLAQNALYQCERGDGCLTHAQRLAWFPLWGTEPMRDVLAYVASTQKTRHPLYLASFDIETGDDDEFHGSGSGAFEALLSALGGTAGASDPTTRQAWIEALSPFFGCYPHASPPTETQKRQAAVAIQQLRSWINNMGNIRPQMHSKALELVPDVLLQEIELCSIVPENPLGPATYQILRDQFNAQNAIALRDNISNTHRIVLWAHHSHVRENWSSTLPSLGQRLRAMIGNQLYTVGLFAGDGEVIAVDDNADPPFSLRKRTFAEGSLEDKLHKLAPYDFILDLSSAGPAWSGKMPFQDENGVGHVTLRDAFDAVIFVHHIHPPEPFAGQLRGP